MPAVDAPGTSEGMTRSLEVDGAERTGAGAGAGAGSEETGAGAEETGEGEEEIEAGGRRT